MIWKYYEIFNLDYYLIIIIGLWIQQDARQKTKKKGKSWISHKYIAVGRINPTKIHSLEFKLRVGIWNSNSTNRNRAHPEQRRKFVLFQCVSKFAIQKRSASNRNSNKTNKQTSKNREMSFQHGKKRISFSCYSHFLILISHTEKSGYRRKYSKPASISGRETFSNDQRHNRNIRFWITWRWRRKGEENASRRDS